jgi:hypothetical protein
MESANRVLTRRALDTLKSIAVGEYVPPEERQKSEEPAAEAEAAAESETIPAGPESASAEASAEGQGEPAPEPEVLTDPSNEAESKAE